jgi:rare lipoprotein A
VSGLLKTTLVGSLIAIAAWFAPRADAGKLDTPRDSSPPTRTISPTPPPDLSGRKRVGKASFYAKMFVGRKMADGSLMDPHGDNAASRTLPLGTTAKVTNIETGKSAVVTIEDRGPYVDGRIVDLSPATAKQIGITPRKGISNVVVAPIAVPLPNGKIKLGAAAREDGASKERRIRLASNASLR